MAAPWAKAGVQPAMSPAQLNGIKRCFAVETRAGGTLRQHCPTHTLFPLPCTYALSPPARSPRLHISPHAPGTHLLAGSECCLQCRQGGGLQAVGGQQGLPCHLQTHKPSPEGVSPQLWVFIRGWGRGLRCGAPGGSLLVDIRAHQKLGLGSSHCNIKGTVTLGA